MDYSNYPYRKCISCEGLGDCPEPEISLDGMGTPEYPNYCPKKEKFNEKTDGTERVDVA